MDACSACFAQRMVFTEQVLAKALSQMVERNPLLLLMRTVIQAIDAYPTLVDFVMEILSKLVIKQLWKMPKLWVGFMKCVSDTTPFLQSVVAVASTPARKCSKQVSEPQRFPGSICKPAESQSFTVEINIECSWSLS
ncbi:hypothetical protein Drorol1_Dr00009064 [Drosera rotundifolia]